MLTKFTIAFTQYNENQFINFKVSESSIAPQGLFKKLNYKLYPNPLV